MTKRADYEKTSPIDKEIIQDISQTSFKMNSVEDMDYGKIGLNSSKHKDLDHRIGDANKIENITKLNSYLDQIRYCLIFILKIV